MTSTVFFTPERPWPSSASVNSTSGIHSFESKPGIPTRLSHPTSRNQHHQKGENKYTRKMRLPPWKRFLSWEERGGRVSAQLMFTQLSPPDSVAFQAEPSWDEIPGSCARQNNGSCFQLVQTGSFLRHIQPTRPRSSTPEHNLIRA